MYQIISIKKHLVYIEVHACNSTKIAPINFKV